MTDKKQINMKLYLSLPFIGKSIIILFLSSFFFSCVEAPITPVDLEDLVIAKYVDSIDTKYSEFNNLLVNTRQNSLLSVRGPFTLFLPTNEAMYKYFEKKGITSIDELDMDEQMELAKNHIYRILISTKDIGDGAISGTNILGDKLTTKFDGSDILINDYARISKRNIEVFNGIIQEVSEVIEPLSKSIYKTIKEMPDYSIFTKGLELTGLKDTLDIVSFDFGNKVAHTYFTLLAVSDSIFNRYGMNNIDDVIGKFTNAPDSITYVENGFYQFIEYHCLDGAFFLNEFDQSKNYPILSFNNNVAIEATDDYKLNFNKTTKEYTGFYASESNIPTKNGAIHIIKDLLPVIEPKPSKITFETTDFFDLKQGDYYGKYYKKWHDGQNTFAKIKWEGDYLQYYYKTGQQNKLGDDCLNMIGNFWCEVTMPKVMKGTYELSLFIWNYWLDYEVWVDGVKTAVVNGSDPVSEVLGTFTWNKTEEHSIKIVSLSFGTLFWDIIYLNPVEE